MTKDEIFRYKANLLEIKRALAGDLTNLEEETLKASPQGASGELSNLPSHLADLGTDNFDREFKLELMENKEEILQAVNGALDRLLEGTFGVCEQCQKKIPKARLKAIPYTNLCIECKTKEERRSRG